MDGPDTANASDNGDLGDTRTLNATVRRWTGRWRPRGQHVVAQFRFPTRIRGGISSDRFPLPPRTRAAGRETSAGLADSASWRRCCSDTWDQIARALAPAPTRQINHDMDHIMVSIWVPNVSDRVRQMSMCQPKAVALRCQSCTRRRSVQDDASLGGGLRR